MIYRVGKRLLKYLGVKPEDVCEIILPGTKGDLVEGVDNFDTLLSQHLFPSKKGCLPVVHVLEARMVKGKPNQIAFRYILEDFDKYVKRVCGANQKRLEKRDVFFRRAEKYLNKWSLKIHGRPKKVADPITL